MIAMVRRASLLAVGIAVVMALDFTASAGAVVPGKVVARTSASGQYAAASLSGSVKKPRAIYVRIIGKVTLGSIALTCARGASISTNGYQRNKSGLYSIPIRPARADDCAVVVTLGGSGTITGEIRYTRRLI